MTQLMKTAGLLTIKEKVRTTTLVHTWKLLHMGRLVRMRDKFQVADDFTIHTQGPSCSFQALATGGEL